MTESNVYDVTDRRASIRAKPGGWDLFGDGHPDSLLYPLRKDKRGLVFPYTPEVMYLPSSSWNPQSFTHSNYPFNSWSHSDPGVITVTADFTANTDEEARYMVAAMHFLRGSMKGGFGLNDPERGVPPGVYNFNYLGDYQFRNIPVVVSSVQMNYAKDVDYVPVNVRVQQSDAGVNQTWVPIHMSTTITLTPQYNVKQIRNKFKLSDFRKGKFIEGEQGTGFL